jgi:hypothetical protein
LERACRSVSMSTCLCDSMSKSAWQFTGEYVTVPHVGQCKLSVSTQVRIWQGEYIMCISVIACNGWYQSLPFCKHMYVSI